jgi:hypothetical protein
MDTKWHHLKTLPRFFNAILSREKTFEVRRNDRGFQVGEYLVLEEYDPEISKYTGRVAVRRITYILDGWFAIDPTAVVLALEVV